MSKVRLSQGHDLVLGIFNVLRVVWTAVTKALQLRMRVTVLQTCLFTKLHTYHESKYIPQVVRKIWKKKKENEDAVYLFAVFTRGVLYVDGREAAGVIFLVKMQ